MTFFMQERSEVLRSKINKCAVAVYQAIILRYPRVHTFSRLEVCYKNKLYVEINIYLHVGIEQRKGVMFSCRFRCAL